MFDASPERAREALRAIDGSARAALAEVRGTVHGAADNHGLRDLDDLTRRLGQAGPRIELEVVGDVAAVPQATAGSAYRIVQESLTNVLRHSAARQVWIRVECGPGEVRVSVDDDGPASAAPPYTSARRVGSGLAGMRARAALHGGSFAAGSNARGGFGVTARFPIGGGR